MESRYKQLFYDLQHALGEAPHAAAMTYEVQSRQQTGLASRIAVRRFALAADAPERLGGRDGGPNPAEYILAALAACQEATYRYYADALEVPLDSVAVRVEGDIDPRGQFAVDPSVRPGFGDIVATVQLTSSAPETDLRRLKAAVDRHSPVVDILRNATPVHLDLEIVAGSEDSVAAA
tara:strand:- start:757 stop:1290 length:534 start_codon:yes stop_codon:yes gene_type:complete